MLTLFVQLDWDIEILRIVAWCNFVNPLSTKIALMLAAHRRERDIWYYRSQRFLSNGKVSVSQELLSNIMKIKFH